MNKKMPKKLVLATETLRNLNAQDLQDVVGAAVTVAQTNCTSCTFTHVCTECNPCN